MFKDRKSKTPQQPEQFSMSPNLHAVQGQERTVGGSEQEKVRKGLSCPLRWLRRPDTRLMASVQFPLPTRQRQVRTDSHKVYSDLHIYTHIPNELMNT